MDLTKITKETLEHYLVKTGIASKITPDQQEYFIATAMARQLNPFLGEIHPQLFWDKDLQKYQLSLVTSYEVYVRRAYASGKLLGWKTWFELDTTTKEIISKVQIAKQGWDVPFVWEVFMSEYASEKMLWKYKKRTMLRKVCISQAFRIAFAEENGSLPYEESELSSIDDNNSPEKTDSAKVVKKPMPDYKTIVSQLSQATKELCTRVKVSPSRLAEIYLSCEGDQEKMKIFLMQIEKNSKAPNPFDPKG